MEMVRLLAVPAFKNLLAGKNTPPDLAEMALSLTPQVLAAKADVDRLQALESFKRLTSPFDGVVSNVSKGSYSGHLPPERQRSIVGP